MQTVQIEVLTTEEQSAKNAAIMAENERIERERIAATNRSAGHRKPEPGDRLWVTTQRGLPRRGRAGVLFVEDRRTELFVIGGDHTAAPEGAIGVSVEAAERILADTALNVSTRPATDAEASSLRSQLAERESELAAARSEIDRLKREARQAAPADPQGRPARLNAARKVADPDGFGGKD